MISRYCFLCSEEAALRKIHDGLIAEGGGLKEILAVNRAIDSKRSLIRSLEDRLYLNPLAKRRGLPPEPKAKAPSQLELAGFGGV